jgi:hypothetical protein
MPLWGANSLPFIICYTLLSSELLALMDILQVWGICIFFLIKYILFQTKFIDFTNNNNNCVWRKIDNKDKRTRKVKKS